MGGRKKDGEGFSNLECGVCRGQHLKRTSRRITHIILPLVTQQPKPFFSARMIRMKLRERNFPSILCNSLITFQNRQFLSIHKRGISGILIKYDIQDVNLVMRN